jgi:uncharacterized membrane protein
MNSYWPQRINYLSLAVGLLAVVHAVGGVGLNSSQREFFVRLTPVNLLLSFGVVMLFHRGTSIGRLLGFIGLAFAIGWGVEVLGVHTGLPFGDYMYTDLQGWRVAGVPLLIGVNWVLLSYTMAVTIRPLVSKNYLLVLVAALGMTLLDVLLEFFAVHQGLWIWEGRTYPGWENFAGWFGVSLLLQRLFLYLIPDARNRVARYYLYLLVLFLGLQLWWMNCGF